MSREFPFREIDFTSKQDVFDYVCEHLREQNARANSTGGACLYRAPDGTACAIGAMFTAKDIDTMAKLGIMNFDVQSISTTTPYLSTIEKLRDGVGLSFATELQRLHDMPINWVQCDDSGRYTGFSESALLVFAASHGLEYKAPTVLS
jgi:hypothetical protein